MSLHDANTSNALDRLTRRRVAAKLGWYRHAAIYLLVNLGLTAIPGHRNWQVYEVLGWGLGVALHGLSVWGLAPGGSMRERLTPRERIRLQQNLQQGAQQNAGNPR